MSTNNKRPNNIFIGVVAICVVGLFFFVYKWSAPEYSLPQKNVILSPHYDDAVLSLGGFIANSKGNALVVSFFTDNGSTTHSKSQWDELSGFKNAKEAVASRKVENANALSLLDAKELNYSYVDSQYRLQDQSTQIRSALMDSIEELIRENKPLKLYGPAFFGDVTHPDHKLLNEAFIAVAKSHIKDPSVSFYIYEDFPYVLSYNKKNTESLKSFLENSYGMKLSEVPARISAMDLLFKEQALLQYPSQIKAFTNLNEDVIKEDKTFTSTRCNGSSCEMTYKIESFK